MIRKSGNRFSEKIILKQRLDHEPIHLNRIMIYHDLSLMLRLG
jgi:hypothetical protein